MVYIEDTRQQAGKHENIRRYFDARGHTVLRSKMLVGDYAQANNGAIAVDTKSGVLELAADCFKQHERFRAELQTAQNAGIELWILTEERLPNERLSDWVSPRFSYYGKNRGRKITYANPATLRKCLDTLSQKYGCRFAFCDPADTGAAIEKILAGRGDVLSLCRY